VPLLPGTVLNVGYNWIVIRFSDVLLMYAEAVNEINGGPTQAARDAYEEVRKRAYRGNTGLIGTTPNTKAAFFDAIVNERYLEFGHEGIRKFDLIRWNLLATKLAEARTKIQAMAARTGQYANVPQYIYFKNVGEEIVYYTASDSTGNAKPFWRPTQAPPSNTLLNPTNPGSLPAGIPQGNIIPKWLRIDWAQHLTVTNAIDALPLYQGIARFFVTGKSELFPFDQATLDSYQGRLKQNPKY
jgi:starch-binding outer membrane protein, SusD/RagB family